MKTCLECYNLFDRISDLMPGSLCPILDCRGSVIELDDNILYTIIQLNKKGYPTDYCCAGHTWGHNPYILFAETVYTDAFPSLPKDFKAEIINEVMLRIDKPIAPCSVADKQSQLMEASVDLIEWVEKLPSSLFLIASFELGDQIDQSDFSNDIRQRLNVTTDYSTGVSDHDKVIQISTYVSLKKARILERKIKSFAKEKRVPVVVDIFN